LMPRSFPGALATALLLAGCAAVRSAPTVHTFRLDYPPPEPTGTPLPVAVRMVPFGIAAAYDHPGFTYQATGGEAGVDYYNRWIDNPARLITDLIARDLAASHRVAAVLQAPSAVPADYEISGQVEAIEEEDDRDGCTAHVRLRVLMVRVPMDGRRRVLLQDAFTADEACTRGVAQSYAEATSQAVRHVSERVCDAALDAIERDGGGR
jgi:ABC-type uncharacterized transport system auxiliary subunit